MSSPQKENGYVPIANEIVEHLAKLRINGEAVQVLWVIFRKTYGYNKKEDAISLSQFVDGTGMKKPEVCRALKKLEDIGVIGKKANTVANKYVFIKNYELWKPLAKKQTLAKKQMTVGKKANNRWRKSHIQKTVSKDNITKDIASQSDAELISEVISLFQDINPSYKKWYGNTTQRKAVDNLLVTHGIEKVKKVLTLLPKTNTLPYFPTITTPVQLEDKWASLSSAMIKKKGELETKKKILL